MNTRLTAILLLALAVAPAHADSIDDAEAKRRGVPVAQVLAEKAARLATQTKPATAARPATVAASRGATAGTIVPADGPRKPSAPYDDIVKRYLAGDWLGLAAEMDAKKADIAALPAGNLADLNYIKNCLAEAEPAWWDPLKAGTMTSFQQTIGKQTVSFKFTSADKPLPMTLTVVDGTFVASVSWPLSEMGSGEPLNLVNAELPFNNTFGFVKADGNSAAVWNMLTAAAATAQVGADVYPTLSPDQKAQLDRYVAFRRNVLAAYYASPPARRLICLQSSYALQKSRDMTAAMLGRRPLGSMLLAELSVRRLRYPSMKFPGTFVMSEANIDNGEHTIASELNGVLLTNKLNLNDDRLLRTAIKEFADANAAWDAPRVTLPNKMFVDLDSSRDSELSAQRFALIKPLFANPPKP